MLIPNSDYVEKYCDLAEALFLEQYNFTFDSVEELDEAHRNAWEDCVGEALHYMDILGIEQDITA